MTAIAIAPPEEAVTARDGIVAIAEREVLPRHDAHQTLFEDPRAGT